MIKWLLPALALGFSAHAVQVSLQWDVPHDPEGLIGGYEIHYGAQPGEYTGVFTVQGAETNTATLEIPDGIQFIAARSVDKTTPPETASLFSNEVATGMREPEDAVFTQLALVTGGEPPPPPATDAVAYYDFEGNFSAVIDRSGNGHDGTLVHATRTQDGYEGKAVDFNGTDASIELGRFDVQGDGLSLTAWIKPRSFNISDARIISKSTSVMPDDHYWMISTASTRKIRFRMKTNGITTTLFSADNVLDIDQWQHVAAVYDGATMKLYVDAQEVASTTKTGIPDTNPGVGVAIGNQPENNADKPFDGLIDEVQIFNYALSHEDLIQAVH